MTSANWAYKSLFKIGDAATPEVFTTVAEVTEITALDMSRDDIEVTSHDSADGYKEFLPGMRDGGEVTIKANWIPADGTHDGSTGLLEQWDDDTTHNYELLLPDTTTKWAFTGFLTGYKNDTPLEEQSTLECKIKLTGKPVLTTS